MVGNRVYGMDQCGQSAAAVSWPLSTAHSGRPRVLRFACPRNPDRAGKDGPGIRHRGLLLRLLLVCRKALAGSALCRGLKLGQPDFPFCLCWANHSWTGIRAGCPGRTLIEQTYPGEADHRAHFDTLLPAFRDHRYLKVDGKPLLLVFDPSDIPEVEKVTALWRSMAVTAGFRACTWSGCLGRMTGTRFSTDSMPPRRRTIFPGVFPGGDPSGSCCMHSTRGPASRRVFIRRLCK